MNAKTLALFSLLGTSLISGVFLFIMYISLNNQDVGLRNRADGLQKKSKVVFDNTWKVIQQTAGVSDKYSEDFNNIYPELMQGRYGNARGGSLLSFVKESNPEFSTKLYEKLQSEIEIQRAQFTTAQQQLIDVQREHRDLVAKFPGSVFISNKTPIEIILVTSEKTEGSFITGQENDINLFQK